MSKPRALSPFALSVFLFLFKLVRRSFGCMRASARACGGGPVNPAPVFANSSQFCEQRCSGSLLGEKRSLPAPLLSMLVTVLV